MSKTIERRSIRCYLCGHTFDVSAKAMSVPCPRCHRALKIENVQVKSYVPVNDLQTCGSIHVAKNGRVVARIIQSGDGIICDGTLEGVVHTDGPMSLGPNSTWKGSELCTRSLLIQDGAKILGHLTVPWIRPADERKSPLKPLVTPVPSPPTSSLPASPQPPLQSSAPAADHLAPAAVSTPSENLASQQPTPSTTQPLTPRPRTPRKLVQIFADPPTPQPPVPVSHQPPSADPPSATPAQPDSPPQPPAAPDPVKTTSTRRPPSKSPAAPFKPLVPGKKPGRK